MPYATYFAAFASLVIGAGSLLAAHTAPIEDLLGPGTVSHTEVWTGLNNGGNPSLPANSGTLDLGLRPNSDSTTTLLRKVSGGGYLASESIYWQSGAGGFTGSLPDMINIMQGVVTPQMAATMLENGVGLDGNGIFNISSSSVAHGASSLVFQIRIGGFGPTEEDFAAGTYLSSYQLTNLFSPIKLTINGNIEVALADYWNVFYGALDIGGEAQGTYSVDEIWAFQWDFSSLGVAVESYTIEFSNYPHASIRELQVDVVSAVPEPSSASLVLMAGGGLAWWIRRSRKQGAS